MNVSFFSRRGQSILQLFGSLLDLPLQVALSPSQFLLGAFKSNVSLDDLPLCVDQLVVDPGQLAIQTIVTIYIAEKLSVHNIHNRPTRLAQAARPAGSAGWK